MYIHRCGAGIGMALWILESYVVLLDATDVYNVKGCTVTPPYLDEYREPDPGLRWVYVCVQCSRNGGSRLKERATIIMLALNELHISIMGGGGGG